MISRPSSQQRDAARASVSGWIATVVSPRTRAPPPIGVDSTQARNQNGKRGVPAGAIGVGQEAADQLRGIKHIF